MEAFGPTRAEIATDRSAFAAPFARLVSYKINRDQRPAIRQWFAGKARVRRIGLTGLSFFGEQSSSIYGLMDWLNRLPLELIWWRCR